jgi:hypothetical protein
MQVKSALTSNCKGSLVDKVTIHKKVSLPYKVSQEL